MDKVQKLLLRYWILPPAVLIYQNYFDLVSIEGRSMAPTLNPHTDRCRDICLVWKTDSLQKNDIVYFTHPSMPYLRLCKRVGGFVGDIYEHNGKSELVREGHFWVKSDEPFRSVDSRELGDVSTGLVIGKAVCIIWPLNRIKLL